MDCNFSEYFQNVIFVVLKYLNNQFINFIYKFEVYLNIFLLIRETFDFIILQTKWCNALLSTMMS
jgi:hypothetical protein